MSIPLIRIMLATCVAFVFSGRMEAAASHCVQQAHAMTHQVVEAPCHGVAQEAAQHTPHAPAKPSPLSEPCQCAAMLKTHVLNETVRVSVRVEHFAWSPPLVVSFASAEVEQDLRPPRA